MKASAETETTALKTKNDRSETASRERAGSILVVYQTRAPLQPD